MNVDGRIRKKAIPRKLHQRAVLGRDAEFNSVKTKAADKLET